MTVPDLWYEALSKTSANFGYFRRTHFRKPTSVREFVASAVRTWCPSFPRIPNILTHRVGNPVGTVSFPLVGNYP